MMSFCDRSLVIPRRDSCGPLETLPLASQELPRQPIGPWTTCATSATGTRMIMAPSKEHPPAVLPGRGAGQPAFLAAASLPRFTPQEGSSNSALRLGVVTVHLPQAVI